MAEITAWTLEEAWRTSLRICLAQGRDYIVQRGSYEGQTRRQLAALTIVVYRPQTRPLAPTMKPGEIPVTNDEAIHRYFEDYLVSPTITVNEDYTYGERIEPWLIPLSLMLQNTPATNQATVEIGKPADLALNDPPCLRVLSWKVVGDKLQLASYWRSWDLYNALPVNLGGLQLLNEMMAEWVGLETGRLVAFSDGAHLYGHSIRLLEG